MVYLLLTFSYFVDLSNRSLFIQILATKSIYCQPKPFRNMHLLGVVCIS
jgi:hypothetical protein